MAGGLALDAYVKACELDPHGVVNVVPLVDLLMAAGRHSQAKQWAIQGLQRNANTRLDPLAGLSVGQLSRLRAIAERPEPAP